MWVYAIYPYNYNIKFIFTVIKAQSGPGFWWYVIFFPCKIEDAIQYINLGHGVQAPKIVIL